MPSTSKPQATLMAMAAHNPAFAKKKGIPMGVARDFNRADQRTGIVKKAGGGAGAMIGHGLSGTQLGDADSLIRKAQDRFATFAEGGAVKKPAGPSAKERKEIRGIIERGKTDAISALRGTRAALIQQQPPPDTELDTDDALARLTQQLAMKDGGEVEAAEAPDEALPQSPELLYQEYAELMDKINDPRIDDELRQQMAERMELIESSLDAVGVEAGDES